MNPITSSYFSCRGEKENQCNNCKSKIRVDCLLYAVPIRLVHEDRNSIRSGVVDFGPEGNLFSCKMKDCLDKLIKKISEQEMISLTTSMIVSKYQKYKCDYCHKLSAKIHRCTTCSTKLYCQQDCIEGDYLVHRKLCRNETEAWKKKEGERKMGLCGKMGEVCTQNSVPMDYVVK